DTATGRSVGIWHRNLDWRLTRALVSDVHARLRRVLDHAPGDARLRLGGPVELVAQVGRLGRADYGSFRGNREHLGGLQAAHEQPLAVDHDVAQVALELQAANGIAAGGRERDELARLTSDVHEIGRAIPCDAT